MEWFLSHIPQVLSLAWVHTYLAIIPLVISLILSLPLGWAAYQHKTVRNIILTTSSILFTIPSLALFVTLPAVIGTKIISPLNVIVALCVYSVSLLTRSVVDALDSVDDSVQSAATALGYTPFQRFIKVQLPLSLPVLMAGARVGAVSNISLVSIGAVIGVSSLGDLFIDGFNRNFPTEIFVGIVATVILAALVDLALVGCEKLMTPWTRVSQRRAA